MSERRPPLPNRQTPFSDAFRAFIAQGWSTAADPLPDPLPAAEFAARRRREISALFPGERLVVPAGGLKVRSNDTDYRFRPHSAFAHLTGLGTDREPDAVLVLEPVDRAAPSDGGTGGSGEDTADSGSDPDGSGHEACLFFTPRAPRDSEEFYANTRYGELWVGRRPSLDEMTALCGIRCAPSEELEAQLAKDADSVPIRVVSDADPTITALVARIRSEHGVGEDQDPARSDSSAQPVQNEAPSVDAEVAAETAVAVVADQGVQEQTADQLEERPEPDQAFVVALSELRLIKDAYEVGQLRDACTATAQAFEAVVTDLPEALRRGRGERWVEGVFGLHARHLGNAVGYDTIAASGDHACTLHWIRNDGELAADDLILIDAGIELDSLYTADITRTLPLSGRFSDAQRMVYEAVLEAQQAGIDAARPGAQFLDVHRAAIAVLAKHLAAWGLLPVSVEQTLSEEGGQHRRWMVHGTSHHLGIDVHDCAQARRELYREGVLAPGMVITVEPGLYLRREDELVPEQLRGIGVRIEDDILITEDGNTILSDALPRDADGVEAWMASLLA